MAHPYETAFRIRADYEHFLWCYYEEHAEMIYMDERVAIITVTQEMYHLTGSNEQETEGLAPLTRQIEGVEVGITIREKPDGTCKASLRTFESVNAAEIAKAFGGGGHPQAAACNLDMDVKTARAKLVEKCGELLV